MDRRDAISRFFSRMNLAFFGEKVQLAAHFLDASHPGEN